MAIGVRARAPGSAIKETQVSGRSVRFKAPEHLPADRSELLVRMLSRPDPAAGGRYW